MEPWQSWAAALVLGGGLAYYYTRDKSAKNRTGRASSISEPQQGTTARRRPDKATAKDKSVAAKAIDTASEAAASASDAASNAVASTQQVVSKKRKVGKTSGSSTPRSSTPAVEQQKAQIPDVSAVEAEEEDNTREWAQQLQARKQGVSLSAPSASSKAIRTVKTNGQQQRNDFPAASAGDVSDMLEPVAAGPSVIRITGEEKPKKQQSIPRPETPQETKKQRQNRRKNEEARLAREEDERARQVLLEKQRRTAREARGEPAKNGLTAAGAPTTSAWAPGSKPNTQALANGVVVPPQPLLDTFDQDATSTASSNDAGTNVTTPATIASIADIPSEEAQLEMLNDMNGWNEVSNVRKSKKKTQVPDSVPDEQPVVKDIKETKLSSFSNAPTSELTKNKTSSKSATFSANNYAALEERERGHPDDDEWL